MIAWLEVSRKNIVTVSRRFRLSHLIKHTVRLIYALDRMNVVFIALLMKQMVPPVQVLEGIKLIGSRIHLASEEVVE